MRKIIRHISLLDTYYECVILFEKFEVIIVMTSFGGESPEVGGFPVAHSTDFVMAETHWLEVDENVVVVSVCLKLARIQNLSKT